MLETIFRTKKWARYGKRGHPEVFHIAGIFCSGSIYSWLRNGDIHGAKGRVCVPCSPLFPSFVSASEGMLVWNDLCFWIWSEGCSKSLVCSQNAEWKKNKTNPNKPNQNNKKKANAVKNGTNNCKRKSNWLILDANYYSFCHEERSPAYTVFIKWFNCSI